jgi:uncharacterized protein (TIGR03083 family)
VPLDYLGHLDHEAALFRAALADADATARVPTCPDWTADDLLWHLGGVFWFWGSIVGRRLDSPAPLEADEPSRPAGHVALLDFYDDSLARAVASLAGADPDVAVWTWSGDSSVGFVRRRMAHEALIHRLDAELTVGPAGAVDPELATDGVTEALQHFFGGFPAEGDYQADGPLGRFRTTDTGAEWLARAGHFSGLDRDGETTYDREPVVDLVTDGTPTCTVTATARDLDAWIWSRPTIDDLVIDGDADFADFAAIFADGVG